VTASVIASHVSRWQPYALCAVRVVAGLLFFQHGAEKMWGFAGARPEPTLFAVRGVAGILESVGGPLIALGLFTRPVAFLLSGEMAVAYFRSWAPRGFFPIANGGEEATLFAFIFLWLWTAGGGAWSIDEWWRARRPRRPSRMAHWEPYTRSLLRIVIGFLLTLHGCRKLFGVLISVAGRRNAPPLALDGLPDVTGYLDLGAGILLMLGLATRPAALAVAIEALLAYAIIAAPRTLWPIRNGGNEALLYVVVLGYIVVAGGGAWGLDAWRSPWRARIGRSSDVNV
jgi:putative oxidoreductase